MDERYKYPRTYHFPWSPGRSSDDKVRAEAETLFEGREVVLTEKMDGENTTIYPNGTCHARSLDSGSGRHPSRDWIKALAAQVGPNLPEGWRICGENLYARHSLPYEDLPTWFLVFSIYDQDNTCLSWSETVEWAELLGLQTVPVIYTGPWPGAEGVQALWESYTPTFGAEAEGYVCRVEGEFQYEEFSRSVAKYVRADHVQTDSHWLFQAITVNGLQD